MSVICLGSGIRVIKLNKLEVMLARRHLPLPSGKFYPVPNFRTKNKAICAFNILSVLGQSSYLFIQ